MSSLVPFPCGLPPRSEKLKRWSVFKSGTTLGEYALEAQIGEGTDGLVFVGRVRGQQVAIKQVHTKGSKAHEDRVAQEVHAHTLCHDHPNVVTVYDFIKTRRDMFLVLELADCGDLFDDILCHGPLGCSDAKPLLRQLVSAVQHLHSRNVAHRDIKPENVMLCARRTTVLLADFGKAKEFRQADGQRTCSDAAGTVRCLAPEVFRAAGPGGTRQFDAMPVDVWAVGIVFFFVVTGQFPFVGDDHNELANNIVARKIAHQAPSSLSHAAKDLLRKMLDPSPATRPDIHAVAAHPFLADPRQVSS